jgi:NAD+ synthase (glutamine-hydrolysing)
MKDGWIKVAAGSVPVRLADPEYNKQQILNRMNEADEAGVNLLVLPELCVTGYSCGDLFFSETLLSAALCAAEEIVHATTTLYPVVVFGMPLRYEGKLFDCAVVAAGGKLLGVVPKTHLAGYGMLSETRHFASAACLGAASLSVELAGCRAPFGAGLVFSHRTLEGYAFGVEISEDARVPAPPAQTMCRLGATVVVNPSATPEVVGGAESRRLQICATTERLCCGYVVANASPTESTQDCVFGAHHLVAARGQLEGESLPFEQAPLLIREIDTARLLHDRRQNNTFVPAEGGKVWFDQPLRETTLTTPIDPMPFVPSDVEARRRRAETILRIQSQGLARRLAHTQAKTAVIGISGGLDSTLALLVAVRAMDLLGRSHEDIVAVTMPGFGTTGRTKSNAVSLCEYLGVTLREIDIQTSVRQHFADIGQPEDRYDVTYENAQARERTQVLMDVANMTGGLVIGTGDLSELALGWATYNGDHMSMYGVNAGLPKTLIRYVVQYEAERLGSSVSRVLWDILDTPVSPELLPADAQGNIAQKTEDLVGPYELHDFFLYYMVRAGETPAKIYRLACVAFAGQYAKDVILHWLRVFCRRFFAQQFKRSCLPDGPAVGSVSFSPRGAWQMPTDAVANLWLTQIEALEAELK